MKKFLTMCCLIAVVTAMGCAQKLGTKEVKSEYATEAAAPNTPVFTLAWSEYPSWSVFGVLAELGAIAPEQGKVGDYEKKYGIDIVLKEADYDPCVAMYGNEQVDAVCITNIDVLNVSTKVTSVAFCPTSTSVGGDALLVTEDVKTIEDLKGVPVRGLDLSVARYCFARNLEIRSLNAKDYNFVQTDPGAASQAMQQGDSNYRAIQVWNPYVNQTLKTTPKARVFTDQHGKPFDSSTIPGEIVDMVVISKKSLDREGGAKFATAVCDAYYHFNGKLNDKSQRDALLVALGSKFSTMNAQEMSRCLEQTKFYSTPTQGKELYASDAFHKAMERIVPWCKDNGYFTDAKSNQVSVPTVSFDPKDHLKASAPPSLTFDSSYLEAVK